MKEPKKTPNVEPAKTAPKATPPMKTSAKPEPAKKEAPKRPTR